MISAAHAIAGRVSPAELAPDHIIPSIFDKAIAAVVADAVKSTREGVSAMRELSAAAVQSAVAAMVIDANCRISPEMLRQLECCRAQEERPLAASILGRIIENDQLAAEQCVPMCQDTGMAVFRVQLGQDVHITGGSLEDAIQEGVRQGYREGYLRKSVVADPVFHRDNTGDNTPAVIYYELAAGDGLTLTFAPKGFGSENMSTVKMLKPADGAEGVKGLCAGRRAPRGSQSLSAHRGGRGHRRHL